MLFRPAKDHSTTHIDIEVPRPNIAPSHIHTSSINLHQDKPTEHHHTHNYLNSTIDIAERQYRTRVQPNFQERVSITSSVEPSKVIINDKMGYYDEDGKSPQHHFISSPSYTNSLHRTLPLLPPRTPQGRRPRDARLPPLLPIRRHRHSLHLLLLLRRRPPKHRHHPNQPHPQR